MRFNYFLFAIFFLFISCRQGKGVTNLNDARIKHLIENLNSADWWTVFHAKDSQVQLEKEAIPYLIANLNSENKFVKLTCTADLIYPGSDKFYGHGWSINYNLDWLCIRSGWVLEDITFQDWGFNNYQNDSNNVLKLKELIAKTNAWWAADSSSWTRLIGITDALKSNNIHTQGKALQYLIRGDFCIDGLTKNYFDKELRPTINILMTSQDSSINEDAKTLLEIVDYKGDFRYNNYPTRCWKQKSPLTNFPPKFISQIFPIPQK